jgi:hypothetical protein
MFTCLTEAKVIVEDWRHDYNHHRPHSALRMTSPARFARTWHAHHGEPLAASLRSPYGLTPRDGDTPTLQPDNNHRLSQAVDL